MTGPIEPRFSAAHLHDFVMNKERHYLAIERAARTLRTTIDQAAKELAKENAEWHDDPLAEGHADFHAPDHIQFSRIARDQAVLSLVKYFLDEATLQSYGKPRRTPTDKV